MRDLAYKQGMNKAAQEYGYANYAEFAKEAEDEGVAHGPTVDPDFDSEYRAQNLSDAIDRSFASTQQYFEDPSSMTQPGLLHGALNRWDRGPVASPEMVAPPLIVSPTTSGGSGG